VPLTLGVSREELITSATRSSDVKSSKQLRISSDAAAQGEVTHRRVGSPFASDRRNSSNSAPTHPQD
jgi:hypothetical protein